jgi:hypothetical protein
MKLASWLVPAAAVASCATSSSATSNVRRPAFSTQTAAPPRSNMLRYLLFGAGRRRIRDCAVATLMAVACVVTLQACGNFNQTASAPTIATATDNSFTVTVPPGWKSEDPPDLPDLGDGQSVTMKKSEVLYLASDNHDRNLNVMAQPVGPYPLPEWGQSALYGAIHVAHSIPERGDILQPTTVGGEAALRSSLTTPAGADITVDAREQMYAVLHRGVGYIFTFTSKLNDVTSATADSDAIVHSWSWSQPSSTSQPSTTISPAQAPLEKLLLSPDQINKVMGTALMTAGKTVTGTYDASTSVADKACLPIQGPAAANAYKDSGWTAVLGQGDLELVTGAVLDQVVVSFPSAREAAAFFSASAQRWPACSDRQYTRTMAGQPDVAISVGSVSNQNGTLSVTKTTQGASGVTCQRALTVADNVAIDIGACRPNGSAAPPADSAVNIAHQIAANVPTK